MLLLSVTVTLVSTTPAPTIPKSFDTSGSADILGSTICIFLGSFWSITILVKWVIYGVACLSISLTKVTAFVAFDISISIIGLGLPVDLGLPSTNFILYFSVQVQHVE